MVENIDIGAVVEKLSAEFDALIDERREITEKSAKLKARADEIDRKLSGIQKTLQGLTLYTSAQEAPTDLMKKTTTTLAEMMKGMESVFDRGIQIPGPDVQKTLSECCRDILRQKKDWVSPVQVREALLAAGFDFSNYTSNPLSSIHTTLKRLMPEGVESATRAEGQVYRWIERDPVRQLADGAKFPSAKHGHVIPPPPSFEESEEEKIGTTESIDNAPEQGYKRKK